MQLSGGFDQYLWDGGNRALNANGTFSGHILWFTFFYADDELE